MKSTNWKTSTGKERCQLLPWNNIAIAIRNSFYNSRTCKRQQCGITPSCLDAGCLFTQQRATWEGVLSAVSETLWLDLEERPFQDKHSWCCGTGTRDWEKGKKNPKMTSQHLLNLWLEAVGVIIHSKAQEQNPNHSLPPRWDLKAQILWWTWQEMLCQVGRWGFCWAVWEAGVSIAAPRAAAPLQLQAARALNKTEIGSLFT